MNEAIGLYQCATSEQFLHFIHLVKDIVTLEGETFYVNATENLIAWVFEPDKDVWCSYPVERDVE